MSHLLNSAARIPQDIRTRIAEEHYPKARQGSNEHFAHLFNLYVQYIAPKNHGLSMHCNSYISTVISNWTTIINHWKQ